MEKTNERSGGPKTPEITPEVLGEEESQGNWNFNHGEIDPDVAKGGQGNRQKLWVPEGASQESQQKGTGKTNLRKDGK